VNRAGGRTWTTAGPHIKGLVSNIFRAIKTAEDVFGETLGRKFKEGKYEATLNRALFEVQVYYFRDPKVRAVTKGKGAAIRKAFEALCATDNDFLASIESTTKSIENYKLRFGRYAKSVSKPLGITLEGLV
jgi:hypothetical protein